MQWFTRQGQPKRNWMFPDSNARRSHHSPDIAPFDVFFSVGWRLSLNGGNIIGKMNYMNQWMKFWQASQSQWLTQSLSTGWIDSNAWLTEMCWLQRTGGNWCNRLCTDNSDQFRYLFNPVNLAIIHLFLPHAPRRLQEDGIPWTICSRYGALLYTRIGDLYMNSTNWNSCKNQLKVLEIPSAWRITDTAHVP
jgi:hypothetical protein